MGVRCARRLALAYGDSLNWRLFARWLADWLTDDWQSASQTGCLPARSPIARWLGVWLSSRAADTVAASESAVGGGGRVVAVVAVVVLTFVVVVAAAAAAISSQRNCFSRDFVESSVSAFLWSRQCCSVSPSLSPYQFASIRSLGWVRIASIASRRKR